MWYMVISLINDIIIIIESGKHNDIFSRFLLSFVDNLMLRLIK